MASFKTGNPTMRLEPGERLTRARAALSELSPAIAGKGGNAQTVRACGLLLRFKLSIDEAWPLLCAWNQSNVPPWDEDTATGSDSLRRVLENTAAREGLAGARVAAPSAPRSAAARAVAIDPAKVVELLTQGYRTSEDAWRKASEAGATLASLYQAGEMVSIVTGAKLAGEKWRPDGHGYTVEAATLATPGEALRNPNVQAGSWMRPNCVRRGSVGSRDDDVESHRFVILESDSLARPAQLALLQRLRAVGLPIALLVDSGSKSYHAWVRVAAASAEEYRAIAGRLLSLPLGFDKACSNVSRLSRFPGAVRGDAVQSLLYLAPSAPPLDESALVKIERVVGLAAATLAPPVEVPAVESVESVGETAAAVDGASVAPPSEERPKLAIEGVKGMQARRLFDLQRPAAGDESELLKHRFLCRGGGALLIGQTGQGKSSLSMQAMLAFALGRPLFGIEPNGPLRCLLVQAENDDGDLTEARDGAAWSVLGASDEDDAETMALLHRNTMVVSENSLVGEKLFESLGRLLGELKPDLLVIDPALSFTEGDTSASRDVGKFLRQQLNPLLSAHRCGCLLIHHTPKPSRDRGAVNTSGSAYAGLGSAEWANWARAVLTLEGLGDGRFKLHAPKRGGRLGWKDGEGKTSFFKVLEHSTNRGGFAWEEVMGPGPAGDDVATKPSKLGVSELVELVPSSDCISKASLVVRMKGAGFAEKWGRDVLAAALSEGRLFEWKLPRPGKVPAVGIGRIEQPVEAETQDTQPY